MADVKLDLEDFIDKNDILVDESMKHHTSFKVGGKADYFIYVRSLKILKKLLNYSKLNKIPIFIIGNGTNLLVLDKGIRGIVIKLELNEIEFNDTTLKVSSDISVSKLSSLCMEKSLAGMEFLTGIPGTVGGAIRMNAGAFGSEIKDILKSVTTLDEHGIINTYLNKDLDFEYRSSIFKTKNEIILNAEFELSKTEKSDITQRMNEYLEQRKKSQPIEYPSAGSTFKRNPNAVTAKLIDECGLKCFSIGDAVVSEKHAGFIVNKGNATAQDILDLINYIKKTVYQKFKEKIELEIEIVGEE